MAGLRAAELLPVGATAITGTATSPPKPRNSAIGDALPRKNRRGPCVAARTEDRIGPRFRLSSVDRRHQSSVGMGVPSSAPSCLPQRHPSGAYEEAGLAGMLTIIKASLLASALMLLESCTGYLTSYQTPCVEGHVCECVRYTTVNRSWLDCRDYGRVKSRAY
jgi:hypothetical protein